MVIRIVFANFMQELLGALQTHILDFTQRLHTVEVERRQLVLELNRMKDECSDLPQKEDIEKLQDQLSTIKGQVFYQNQKITPTAVYIQ